MAGAHVRERQATGRQAEQLACRHLTRHGLTLITSNYRCKHGEIDLIMRHDDMVVFIEVRYRRHARYGSALESVTPVKQQRLIRTARHWLQHNLHEHTKAMRFDVISLQPQHDNQPEVIWIQDAFQT